MKKILTFIIVLSSILSTNAQKITMFGNYSEQVISMCSQGCEFYEIGAFRLTEALELDREDGMAIKMSVSVMASGEIVTVKELPTIAGPKADNSKSGVYQKVERLKVSDFSEIDVLEYTIDDENYKEFKAGNDYYLNIKIKSPIGIDFLLKLAVEFGEYQNFKLQANQTAELKYKVKNNGYSSRVKITLVKRSINTQKLYHAVYEDAKNSGIMFYFEEYADIEQAHK